ncbi:ABC transporter ATP-binding protein [Microbacterium lacticum]|uniref:ABC transporter ATP-binding protein n=1 Tax=Microbacterium lacticum TaxID=33885 RepID=UPI003A864098
MRAEASTVAPVHRPETGEIVLRAQGLHRSFGLTRALRGIDLEVTAGEILAVMGPSGSGKSTLLHVLAGVIRPDQGQVELDGRRIDDLGEAARARLRLTEFGFVFQFGQLLPDLSARDNVTIPLLLAGVRRGNALVRADETLAELGLADHARKLPAQLSGGQAQRVAVARALVTEPRVLFADEPTGSLDSLAAEKVLLSLTERARQRRTTVVIITHDPRTAAYADREVVVRDGRLSGATV